LAAVARAALDFSQIGLIVQWVGILVVGGLLLFLTRSIRRRSLDAWAASWWCLAAALGVLSQEFRLGPGPSHHLLRAAYFLGEYGFGFLLVAGCRNFASGATLGRKAWRWLPAGAAVALGLTWISEDFNVQFAVHAAIVGGLLIVALVALARARARQGGPGLTVMCVALGLLALDFCHYVPVFALAAKRGMGGRFAYLEYTSSIDLILEVVLGFGMVMLTMESLRREAEQANRELQGALRRLEDLARTDPLTSALNRRAYQGLVAAGGGGAGAELAGCVVVADVNRLKEINDRHGHVWGDMAIRRVATAIRSVIRADDLLFRWGGDEFLIILRNIDEQEAARRFERVNQILGKEATPAEEAGGATPGNDGRPPLSVSFGVAPFGRAATLDAAIERADALMYEAKGRAAKAG
jgi:diguanylate cyclase (GGDEF)-like protein